MASKIIHASDGPDNSESAAAARVPDVPTWLAARREHQTPASSTATPFKSGANSQTGAAPFVRETSVETRASDAKREVPLKPDPASLTWNRRFSNWLSRQEMIGIATSLLVHFVILAILASILVSQVNLTEVSTIWGTVGETDDFAADVILDTSADSLDMGESAPLQLNDASQALESQSTHGEIAESMQVGMGGNGEGGEGDAGEGISMGVASLKIPGHAQTKGSFSAWADPRDPKPGEDYFVVIQIKLPKNVSKYRGGDISGVIIGTDSYRQVIRLKPTDQLPIEDGSVQIRIHVPGGGRLVRDTIRVESKLLKEKQTFEIEF